MNNYKHIPTNKVFEPVDHGESYKGTQCYINDRDVVPFYIIKDSKEWEEIGIGAPNLSRNALIKLAKSKS